jgi:predicted HTH domain antitoxin
MMKNWHMETLIVEIPEMVRQALQRTPEEMAQDMGLYTALMLFQQGKLSSGAAAALAGVSRVLFFDLCAKYEIPISQITPKDLEQESL